MIVPVAFTVKHEDMPEEFALTESGLLPRHTYEKTRITLVVMDVESGQTRGFSAQVLFDQSADFGHELMTFFHRPEGEGIPSWGSPEYVRQLRDALNEVLGDEDS